MADAYGLDALMPKARRAPGDAEPDAELGGDELLAEAIVRPTLGARRYADALADDAGNTEREIELVRGVSIIYASGCEDAAAFAAGTSAIKAATHYIPT